MNKESRGLGISNIKNEITLLVNLLEVDRANTERLKLEPRDRAELEINHRILFGLNDDQKNKLVEFYDELLEHISKWFVENNEPVCPISNWSWVLKRLGFVQPTNFFYMVARNDASVWRWKNRQGEWSEFNRFNVQRKIDFLKKSLTAEKTSLEDKLTKGDLF